MYMKNTIKTMEVQSLINLGDNQVALLGTAILNNDTEPTDVQLVCKVEQLNIVTPKIDA